MEKEIYQTDLQEVKAFLMKLLYLQIPEPSFSRIKHLVEEAAAKENDSTFFYVAYSSVWRYSGKTKLQLSEEDLKWSATIRKGWTIKNWTTDQACRALLLISLPHQNKEVFLKRLNKLAETADVGELVALYLTLPLLPHPEILCERAAEGVRNNMTLVYDAIALDNPFPADYMKENAWNQMILKGIFNNRPLNRIVDLDKRANPTLAAMLSAFAHERWAAGRTVSPELWRGVAPFINQEFLPDIEKVFGQVDPLEQQAAALACADSNFPDAKELLAKRPDLKIYIDEKKLSWQTLSELLSNN
jgi:hypothetical protein